MSGQSSKNYEKKRGKRASELRKGKKLCCRDINLNPLYSSEDLKSSLSCALRNRTNFTFDNGAKIISEPFTHCVLPDFLTSENIVDELHNVVSGLFFEEKNNDLYKFSQSSDFKTMKKPLIVSMMHFLYKTFRPWLSELLGYSLDESIDVSASHYNSGDYLLCHNDQCQRRKIAFIYYLVPDWSSDDGGTLDFFSTRKNVPHTILSSLVPKSNSCVFFEVTPYSYHQVSEVLTEKSRFTISGWYHSEPAERIADLPLQLQTSLPGFCSGLLTDFVNPFYLKKEHIAAIRAQFEEDSEVQLYSFLLPEVYQHVCRELNECNTWTAVGPPHKRSFEELKIDCLSPFTSNVHRFLHSDMFLHFLSSLIGLNLCIPVELDSNHSSPSSSTESSALPSSSTESSPSSSAPFLDNTSVSSSLLSVKSSSPTPTKIKCFHSQICKWTHRSYSLVHDLNESSVEHSLDAFLFFNCREWDEVHGGKIVYFSNESEEALVEVVPVDNSFSLVYREGDVMHFTKYINHKVNERRTPYYHCMSSNFF